MKSPFRSRAGSTWLSTGVATRIRTRFLATVMDTRPPASSDSRRDVRLAWHAEVTLTLVARDETRWWVWFLPRYTASGPGPFTPVSTVICSAFVHTRHGDLAASSFLWLLAAAAPSRSPR